MPGININRVVLTGNLTRNPELRSTSGGTSVCSLRVACNTRRKVGEQWVAKPNFFDVTVWGAHGENCARFLTKGRPVAIDGRLEWREWEHDDTKRQAVEIIADSVQFLGASDYADGDGDGVTPRPEDPADEREYQPAGAPASDTADDDAPL